MAVNKEELKKYKKMWAERNKQKIIGIEKLRLNFVKKWGKLIIKEKNKV